MPAGGTQHLAGFRIMRRGSRHQAFEHARMGDLVIRRALVVRHEVQLLENGVPRGERIEAVDAGGA